MQCTKIEPILTFIMNDNSVHFFLENENYNAEEELEEPVFLANANSCPLRERRELLMHAFSSQILFRL